jgi:hypothetical protein
VEHAFVGEHRLILERRTEGVARDVAAGQHRDHARHGLGFAGIDLDDPCGGDACPLDLGVQHARQVHVVDVLRRAEAVQPGVRAGRALPHRRRLLTRFGDQDLDRKRNQRRRRGRAQ